MKVTQFAVNELVFYHPIVTGDTIQLEMTQVTENVPKTVKPVVQTITDNWFKCQFTTVTGQTQENLTGGTIYLRYDGYYDYKLKRNGTVIEDSQFFMVGPVQTVVEVSGTTGYVVTNPYAGSSGSSGAAGSSGASGLNGTSGVTGSSGASGSSGSSGRTGTSGVDGNFYGTSGRNGTNGLTGSSGSSGLTGSSGSSGGNGTSGQNGTNGINGTSGQNGTSGIKGDAGTSGINATAGSSGNSGSSGTSASSGISGTNGMDGTGGVSGSSGSSGQNGLSSSYYRYNAIVNSQAPPINSGAVEWNNATQTGSTQVYLSHITSDNNDIEVILGGTGIGSRLIIQDRNNSENYQRFTVTSVTVTTGAYVTFGVTYVNGGYSFTNNHDLIVIVQSVGIAGTSGSSGATGSSGSSGINGSSGSSGQTGATGTSGISGSSGTSYASGFIQTRAGSINTTGSGNKWVAFSTNMPSTNYSVTMESYSNVNQDYLTLVEKQISGFSFSQDNTGTDTVEWMVMEYNNSTNGIAYGTSGTSGLTGSSGTAGPAGTSGTTGPGGTAGSSGVSTEFISASVMDNGKNLYSNSTLTYRNLIPITYSAGSTPTYTVDRAFYFLTTLKAGMPINSFALYNRIANASIVYYVAIYEAISTTVNGKQLLSPGNVLHTFNTQTFSNATTGLKSLTSLGITLAASSITDTYFIALGVTGASGSVTSAPALFATANATVGTAPTPTPMAFAPSATFTGTFNNNPFTVPALLLGTLTNGAVPYFLVT